MYNMMENLNGHVAESMENCLNIPNQTIVSEPTKSGTNY